MIKVFGAPPSRAMRVIWMLEEMGLDYEVRPVDFANRFRDKEFMAINPAGFLPAMSDGDVAMFESIAIIQYLSERYGPTPLAPRLGDDNYPLYLQFLHFGEASLAAPLNVTIGSMFFAPEEHRENFGAKLAVDMGVNRSRALARQLKKTAYLAGDAFTAADISCAYFLGFAERFAFADRIDPVLLDYQARVTARPAYVRAAAQSASLMAH